MKILHFEDTAEYALIFHRVLAELDPAVEITLAVDPVKGLSQFNVNNYDLIICDGQLPELNGDHVVHRIRNMYNSKTVIIANSASMPYNTQMMKSGANFMITKGNLYDQLHQAHWKNLLIAVKMIKEAKKVA